MSKLPDQLREFEDADTARNLIYDNVLESLKKRFPIEDDEYRLELSNVKYDGPKDFTLEQQKQALMKDRQLRTPVKGKWRLVHKPSKQVLDEREDVVMHVPYYTPRGTFLYNGNEYTIANQSRLKPGAYVRKKRTGEIEAHFNVKPGTGKGFRIHLEPETGVFRAIVGQSKVPVYPLMQIMGVSDKELMKVWGPELLEKNIKVSDNKAVEKLYKRLSGYKYDAKLNEDQQKQFIKESLPQFEMDPDVMARTLGLTNTKGITPQALVRSTQKLLNVSKGEEKPDDRDTLVFSSIHSVEDFLPERIDKDAGRLSRSLLYKARRARGLKPVARGALNPYMSGFLLGSGLTMPLEETNPMSTLEQISRVTKLGEGGISSAESITDEARNVNNTQFGFIDPIAGPEGLNIGIDVRAAYRTFKGRDGKLYGEFTDPRSGRKIYRSAEDAADMTIAFPGEMEKPGPTAAAMVKGKIDRVPKKNVDAVVPSFGHMMSANANLNPMPTGVMPGRQFYGTKFWGQYLPQVKGEVPLVDTVMPDSDKTFSEHYGRKVGTVQSKTGGTVTRVTSNGITVKDDSGKTQTYELVKDFPFNRLTGITYKPTVQAGDKVNVGDMLAHSNFTDPKSGALSLGVNLKTAVMPARGMSYEDAYVISESAAKKMSTERLYGYDQEAKHGVEISKNRYLSMFPKEFTKDQYEKIGPDGIIKPGAIVEKGDPLILATGPKLLTSSDAQLGKLHKVLRNTVTNKSVVWEHDYPGVIADTAMTRNGAKVNVRSTPPVNIGDKLSTRFGLKGVVGKIIPDDEMPRDVSTNQPYELLLNPMGVLSRVAPNQLVELALGKMAKQTGQQVRLPQTPPPEGWALWAQKQLADAGVKEDSDVFDPKTGKTIKGVGDGYTYLSAFHHLAAKKLSARGEEGGYTLDEQPAKGGHTGAKRFSTMDVNAALAHGATDVIKDVATIRGTKNEEFWKALKMGRPLPAPQVPFVYDKFINTLKAGGININQKGDTMDLLPMTDDDVTNLSKGALSKSDLVNSNFDPIPGGLFDPGRTGGMSGNKWTHIDLVEPVPNPIMAEPIRRLLGLRKQDLLDIVAGRQELEGKTGGAAIQSALANIDIDEQIAYHKERVKKLRGANRDNSVKALGYLSAAKAQGVHPSKWVISKVPVLPPVFRPISRLGDMALVTDMNELYRDLIETNSAIKELRKELPDSAITNEKQTLYEAVSAAYGLGEPVTEEGKSKRLKGAVRQVIGSSPKTGLFQSKVISKPVDVVGRGVVTPDPNLDMDSIGIPEDSAWSLYKDFVTRRLVRRGYPALRAVELIDQRAPVAQEMLQQEMKERPVLVDRAPTWHKFNLLAFYPHIVDEDVIRVSPLITKGFNMDFDGDQANFHVPVSDKAVDQAKSRMLPSRNLFSLTDLKSVQHTPTMEMTLGLYQLTQNAKRKKPVVFNTLEDAKKAYKKGEIGINDPITVLK